MEIIRRDTEHAIRALVHLALAESREASCAEIARSCDIPKSFAYRILRHLADAGMVAGRPGRSGGFRLRASPRRITLRRVVSAIQGPLTVSKCVVDPSFCVRRTGCPVSAGWRKLQKEITKFLGSTTLDDVLCAVK